jgi:endonuclease YncB( thermonuclease family)
MPTLYAYRATVTGVSDGDTVAMVIGLGFGASLTFKRVRIAGINAPEASMPEGVAATKHLRELLGLTDIAPTVRVGVQTFLDRADKYGRPLVRITTPSGINVGAQMVTDGHATLLGPLKP